MLFLGITLSLLVRVGEIQADDYPVWPEYNVAFEHLDLQITWEGSDEISGVATYRIRPFQNHPDEIRLQAPNLEIQSVVLDNRPVQITRDGQEIRLHVESFRLEAAQSYNLRISYQGKPEFGLRYGADNVIRSSLLPKSVRHWLPSFDHPRTRLTYEFTLNVPQGQVGIASGKKIRQRDRNGTSEWVWASETPVSLSNLVWVAGEFQMESAMFGTKNARIFVHKGISEFPVTQTLERTISEIRRAEQALNQEFPAEELNLIILDDDFWETKSFSQNLGFVYLKNADVALYATRAILGQWIGVRLATETWRDAEALAIILEKLASEHGFAFENSALYRYQELRIPPNPYDAFSLARAADWTPETDFFRSTVRASLPDILALSPGLYQWTHFAELWYARSGQPWKQPIAPPPISVPDTLTITIRSQADHVNNRVILEVGAGRAFDFEVKIATRDRVRVFDVSATGNGDRIPITTTDGRVLAIVPRVDESKAIRIQEEKSLTLWINQLRSSQLSTEDRLAAARGLSHYQDDPDLQLALRDALNLVEAYDDITAEIYRTIGKVTSGATGVQNLFLRGLEHHSELVRKASLESLQYYQGNEEITERVFGIISRSPDITFVNHAIPVYGRLIADADYEAFVGQLLREDEDLEFTRTLLDELFTLENRAFAIQRAETYLTNRYPFDIRMQTLQLLIAHDDSRSRWRDRQRNLSRDPDPRMRYLVLQMAKKDGNTALLESRKRTEQDARVRMLLD